jgi:hypothetical protein
MSFLSFLKNYTQVQFCIVLFINDILKKKPDLL